MPLTRLDHVNLRTARLDEMIAWYETVLGLAPGPRPNFSFGGAWLYLGERAVVHIIEVDPPDGAGSETPLKLEHFAFAATDRTAFEAVLKQHNIPHRAALLPGTDSTQINIWDPDGNHIHVDFDVE